MNLAKSEIKYQLVISSSFPSHHRHKDNENIPMSIKYSYQQIFPTADTSIRYRLI